MWRNRPVNMGNIASPWRYDAGANSLPPGLDIAGYRGWFGGGLTLIALRRKDRARHGAPRES